MYVDTDKLPEWLTIAPTETENGKYTQSKQEKTKNEEVPKEKNSSFYNFDNIINTDWIKPEIKDLFSKLRKIFLSRKWLNEEVKSINDKSRYASIYYRGRISRNKLFSLLIGKSSIYIQGNWPLKVPQNLAELLNNYGIKYEKKGQIMTGDWYFKPIKTNADFQKLKNFFQEYKEKFSEK